jgi:L-iditol 2-dehydrogenase
MYYNNRDVRVQEMPKPEIGAGEMLVKVMASGICGSDVLEWYRIKKAPLVLGHEIAGEIVEVGEGVSRYRCGQRVFVSHHIPCNTCRYCLNGHHTACHTLHTTNFFPGGFTEFLRVPALNVDRGVFVLPAEMSYDEPLACVLRGQRNARLKPGQTVAVIGSGISGLLHQLSARAHGAGRIFATDINPYRLEQARSFGADAAFHAKENIPEKIREHNDGRLADLVIVCTGAMPAMMQALDSVDAGGTILFFASTDPGVALPVPLDRFWRNSVTLLPSYGNSPYDAEVAIDLIRSRRVAVQEMITHRLPLAQIQEGFRLVAQSAESIKVIIHPHD